MPWRRTWQPIPVFLAGASHGQRSLVGYSPWGHKESDTTEQLTRQTWANHPDWIFPCMKMHAGTVLFPPFSLILPTRVVCVSSLYEFIIWSSALLVWFLTPCTTFSNEVSSMWLNPVAALQPSLSLTPLKHLTPLTIPFLSSFLIYFLNFSMWTKFKVFIEFVALLCFLAIRQMRS